LRVDAIFFLSLVVILILDRAVRVVHLVITGRADAPGNGETDMTNELNNAVQAFIVAPAESNKALDAYEAIQQWLVAGYETDGHTGKEIDLMDLKAEADLLIERGRGRS